MPRPQVLGTRTRQDRAGFIYQTEMGEMLPTADAVTCMHAQEPDRPHDPCDAQERRGGTGLDKSRLAGRIHSARARAEWEVPRLRLVCVMSALGRKRQG